MAFVDCPIHGGNIATMASRKLVNDVEVERKMISKGDIIFISVHIDDEIEIPGFWAYREQLEEIGPIVKPPATEIDYERNLDVLSFRCPCCLYCFENAVGEKESRL